MSIVCEKVKNSVEKRRTTVCKSKILAVQKDEYRPEEKIRLKNSSTLTLRGFMLSLGTKRVEEGIPKRNGMF